MRSLFLCTLLILLEVSSALTRNGICLDKTKAFCKLSPLCMQQVEFSSKTFKSNILIEAEAGTPLGDVAEKANVIIPYQCKKGECGTCKVMVDGKWIKTCVTTVPSLPAGQMFKVFVRPAKQKSKFFSPRSFIEGVINNFLGVIGFIWKALTFSNQEFNDRLKKEKELEAIVEARKKAKGAMA